MRHARRRSATLLIACVLAALALASCGATTAGALGGGGVATTGTPGTPIVGDTVKTVCPGKTQYMVNNPPYIVGVPAIAPRNNCTPSYTVQDVLAYLSKPFGMGKIQVVGQPKVTLVLFTTSKHASELMHGEYIGLADDAVVCYVELSGTFIGDAPPGVKPATSHTGVIVFDGHSGNILVEGG